MNTEQTKQQLFHISQETFLSFVRTMIGGHLGRPDDEHPLPPGPWDPVIRLALERINVFGPSPEPWRSKEPVFGQGAGWQLGNPVPWNIIFASIAERHPEIFNAVGGGQSFRAEVELNPQPLPPRFTFLRSVAQVVISRAELFQEIADATPREGEPQGSIIVGGYIGRFSEDICGNGFRWKWPFPGPRPYWFTDQLDGIDLLVMATQIEQAAKESFSPDLNRHLAGASTKLTEAGLSRMQ